MNGETGKSALSKRVINQIAVIDDDPVVGEYIRECLRENGNYEVRVFRDPLIGCKSVLEKATDCVFLDIHMPVQDGLETLSQLRGHKPYLPVVIITGNPSIEISIEALRQGASDFLTKPFTSDGLLLCLERVKREVELLQEKIRLEAELKARDDISMLNEELSKRIELQSALFAISQELDAANNESEIEQRMVELACIHLNVKKATLHFLHDDFEGLVLASCKGIDLSDTGGIVVPYGRSIIRRVLESGCPYVASNLNGSPRLDPFFSGWKLLNPPLVCFPIIIGRKVRGVFSIGERESGCPFTGRDLTLLEFLVQKATMALENISLYGELTRSFYGTMQALVTALEAKDVYTKWHSQRVTEYAIRIGDLLGCSREEMDSLKTITFLHDIGKLGLQDSLLNKPGNLSKREFQTIQLHPLIGEKIVENIGLTQEEIAIIRNHHECWDGSGYPDGLKEEDIPYLARIVSVADSFDAMTSNRSYRVALNSEEAMIRLIEQRGKQFDPRVVDAFITALRDDAGRVRIASPSTPSETDFPFSVQRGYNVNGVINNDQFEVSHSS